MKASFWTALCSSTPALWWTLGTLCNSLQTPLPLLVISTPLHTTWSVRPPQTRDPLSRPQQQHPQAPPRRIYVATVKCLSRLHCREAAGPQSKGAAKLLTCWQCQKQRVCSRHPVKYGRQLQWLRYRDRPQDLHRLKLQVGKQNAKQRVLMPSRACPAGTAGRACLHGQLMCNCSAVVSMSEQYAAPRHKLRGRATVPPLLKPWTVL